jgi:hypothetical protein
MAHTEVERIGKEPAIVFFFQNGCVRLVVKKIQLYSFSLSD